MDSAANSAIILALVAIVGTVITALFKLLNDNTKALINLDKTTATGNREAKERNGHLGEQSIKLGEMITIQASDISSIKFSSQTAAETNSRMERLLSDSAKTLKHDTAVAKHDTESVALELAKTNSK